jgi:hypothetical protein
MEVDRSELHNLAGKQKRLEAELLGQYRAWASQTGVKDWELLLPRLLAAWNLASVDG